MSEAVFVLGMHRSGTSMIAGLLRILGVDFGLDSDLMAASKYNPKGFFEHVPLNGINVEVMVKFGGEWYAPPNFPKGWEDSNELAALRKSATERLGQYFGRSQTWGFKDPRTCITLPFWRKVVQGPMRAVIVVRNPIDAARSVQDVQKILATEASELWLKHMVGAFVGSHGLARHVIFYEDVLADVRGEFIRLAMFLGRPVTPGQLAQADKFSDRGLRHFESSKADIEGGHGISGRVRKAYLTIRAFGDVAKMGKLEPEDHAHIEEILSKL